MNISEKDTQPYAARYNGLENVIVPPEQPLYAEWQATEKDILDPPQYSAAPTQRHTGHSGPSMLSKPTKRPWWARLLVDSMLVPFVQGFMLNLGIHWIRHWRKTGGLVGVFRSYTSKPRS